MCNRKYIYCIYKNKQIILLKVECTGPGRGLIYKKTLGVLPGEYLGSGAV